GALVALVVGVADHALGQGRGAGLRRHRADLGLVGSIRGLGQIAIVIVSLFADHLTSRGGRLDAPLCAGSLLAPALATAATAATPPAPLPIAALGRRGGRRDLFLGLLVARQR